MDYKYIEQLLDRYWACETTLEEEAILRKFFAQADIPAHLLCYRDLFAAEEEMKEPQLSEDFDQRVMAAINRPTAQAAKMTFAQRLRPFYQAAAVVAILLSIGMAAQQGFQHSDAEDINFAQTATEDTAILFTDMPEPLQQTEAALPAEKADSMKVMKP